ncbi:hypothetical protein TNCV_34311 [Trichonephila clavipes]|nr:hypothetical protein TNCV_34311 [Trichonephila clavipes]
MKISFCQNSSSVETRKYQRKLKLDGTRATARQRLFPEGWEENWTIAESSANHPESSCCGIIRKQASTDGGVLWKVMCVDVVQVW